MLIVAICNLVYSAIYAVGIYRYHASLSLVPNIDIAKCEMPGSFILACYGIFLVLLPGSMLLLVYFLSTMYKVAHLMIALICPVSLSHTKKNWRDIPSGSYEHYNDEFDFEADPQVPPPTHAI